MKIESCYAPIQTIAAEILAIEIKNNKYDLHWSMTLLITKKG